MIRPALISFFTLAVIDTLGLLGGPTTLDLLFR